MPDVTLRADFEKLIDVRLREAKLLIAQNEWDGAYYLAGYVIEYALKVKIIADLMKSDYYPDSKTAGTFYSHNLTQLAKLAGLFDKVNEDLAVVVQWEIVKIWSEQTRYTTGKEEQDARVLVKAIEEGVLPWIKAHW